MTYETEEEEPMVFPVVTVCSNVPVRQPPKHMSDIKEYDIYHFKEDIPSSYNDLHNYLTLNSSYQDPRVFMNSTVLTVKNEMDILSKLAKYNESMRFQFAEIPHKLIRLAIRRVSKETTRADNWVYNVFNNLYFGNCITFNPNQYLQVFDPPPYNATIISGFYYSNEVPNYRNGLDEQDTIVSKYQVMVIHEPYTQPIFDYKNIIRLPSSVDTYLSFTKIDHVHEQNCISRDNFTFPDYPREYVNTGHNYQYSMEACATNCLQQLTMKYCNCQIPWFHSTTHLPVCKGCSKIPQNELENRCACKPSCMYSTLFDINIFQQKSSLNSAQIEQEEGFKKKQEEIALDFKAKGVRVDDLIDKSLYLSKAKITQVMIEAESLVTEVNKFTPSCLAEKVLSKSGSILGCYLGLSIMMFIEVAYDYIVKLIHQCNMKPAVSFEAAWNSMEIKGKMISSISLIVRIWNSKNGFKLFWTIVLLGGIVNTVKQGHELFTLYSKYPSSQKITTVGRVIFPSVTICSRNYFSKTVQSSAKDQLKDKYRDLISMKKSYEDVTMAFKSYLYEFSDEFRYQLGPKWPEYIQECQIIANNSKYNCSNVIEFAMINYGNCATINSGINLDSDYDYITEMSLELRLIESEYLEFVDELSLFLLLHGKGTSPNSVSTDSAINIQTNKNYTITFSTLLTERLPSPYPSNCISQQSLEYQWKNNFYLPNTSYLYTYQECLSSCFFNVTFEDETYFEFESNYNTPRHSVEKWYLSFLEFQHKGRLDISEKNVFQLYSQKTFKPQQLSDCGCRLSCREVNHKIEEIYYITRKHEIKMTDEKEIDERNIDNEEHGQDANGKKPPKKEFRWPNETSWITIRPMEEITVATTEVEALTVQSIK
ncbi:hypothetical protein CHUAL_011678 [Chamberlinius hualienensis]